MANDSLRGHPMYLDGEEWRYVDNEEITAGQQPRPCGRCGNHRTREGHDHCLGAIPGVVNACCGHGEDALAYVQTNSGASLKGRKAVAFFRIRCPSHSARNGGGG